MTAVVTRSRVAAGALALFVAGVAVGMGSRQARPAPATRADLSARRIVSAGRDLKGELALLDRARAALSAESPRQALDVLRHYQDRYPEGAYVPEATALQVETSMRLGRSGEARGLATRFVDEHQGLLLAARVAAVAGLPPP